MGWAETIDNYQLKFDVWSRSNGCAAADLVCGGDFPAQGVLYEVPDNLMSRDSAPAGRRSFDAIEGDAYVRRSIAVKRRDGTIVEAQTYVVLTPQTGLLTSADYVAHIIRGLREHGADYAYINRVRDAALRNNPTIAEQIQQL